MTTFEPLILLALIAIEIILAIGIYAIKQELKSIKANNTEKFDLLVKAIVADLSRTRKAAVICEDKITELVAFEKEHDEMMKRCDELNKFNIARLKAAIHTYKTEPFPPKDVIGVTATGICQECNSKSECEHYDVNRNRCFVADTKED